MKQVFEANTKLRRVICAVLVAIMVIGMIPLAAPKAAAIGSGDILYLKPNGATDAGAWFAVWFFGGSGADQMVRMEKYDNNLYYCTVPEGGYTKCTFVRKNPSNQNLDWNGVWNQSSDQYLSSGNRFVVNDGSMNGGWDTIADVVTPSQPTTPEENTTLYVNTTFYDYKSDHELNGNPLSSKEWKGFDNGNGWDSWYIFRNFNSHLSGYYDGDSQGNNKVKVPIYMGHFQPISGYYDYKDFESQKNYHLYGYDGNNENRFMSVNNSLIDINNGWNTSHIDSAAWGIVAPTLEGTDKKLMAATTNSGTIAHPLFDKDFLTEKYNGRTYANIYENVKFPFTKSEINGDGIEYWVFDSEKTTLKMNSDFSELEKVSSPGNGFKNRESNNGIKTQTGFFPFNTGNESHAGQYNYGYGMRLDLEFDLTYDGMLPDEYGQRHPMIFSFSGDDDVWVFIDDQLVLDIGGSHGKVTGTINFADKVATVSKVKASLGDTSPDDEKTNIPGYQKEFTLGNTNDGHHTLTMFYMERGMWESNMSISFNFVPKSALEAATTTVKVEKKWDADNIPESINVQLQRRLAGQAWEAVGENVELKAATGWAHTFTDVEKFNDFARTQKYEFRVVELNNDNTVLESGDSNYLGQIVAYGVMYGDEATGFKQTITNIKPDNSVIVIDFGLPVDITIDTRIDNTTGTLYGIGDASKLPIGQSKNFAHTDLITNPDNRYNADHGYATLNGNKIRYTPTDMKMDKADLIGYALQYTSGGTTHYYYSTVTIIPAANIYYEDGFLSFNDYEATPDYSYGQWESVTDKNYKDGDKTQKEDRPEFGNDYDADNVYGYDQAYDNYTLYSLGSAMKVTVDKKAGFYNTAPTATFTFTGTGFDVISLTDNDSGALIVEVRTDENSEPFINYVVNNYYGMKYDPNRGWYIPDKDDGNCLYQVPVIKVDDLAYGSYHVTIRAAYLASQDMTNNNGNYTLWVDAIRIYNPAQNDKTSNDAYLDDGESNPHLTTVKKLLTTPNSFGNGYGANGVIFVEGKDNKVTMEEYKNQGPNNETYLKNGNGIAFKLRYNGNDTPDVALQIGAKLAVGSEATLVFNGKNLTTLKTATNMFYKLDGISWTEKTENNQTFYESNAIVLSCKAGSGDILSLTDLKLTGADADEIWDYYNPESTEPALFMAVVDNGVFDFAVDVMSAPVVNPVTLTGNSFSLSFEDEILVNYYYAISDVTNVTEHGMLVFNTDPGAADIAKADQKYDAPVFVESADLYACTTSGIAAKEMGDSRYYCAYAKLSDGTIVYSELNQYSPKQYAMSRLENSENENLKSLCVAMLNYGAAAQSYFGYKTDALMNADLTDAQKALVGEYNADLFTGAVAADPAKVNGCFASTEAGFEQISASVSFEGAFALNFYFDLDRENSEVVFYYWTKEAYESADELSDTNCTGSIAATADANGIFYAPITGIAAKELDDTIYVAATYTIDGETFCSGVIAYSLSTYCMRHANGNMGQLAQATAMYGYYAENYFGASSQELI